MCLEESRARIPKTFFFVSLRQSCFTECRHHFLRELGSTFTIRINTKFVMVKSPICTYCSCILSRKVNTIKIDETTENQQVSWATLICIHNFLHPCLESIPLIAKANDKTKVTAICALSFVHIYFHQSFKTILCYYVYLPSD